MWHSIDLHVVHSRKCHNAFLHKIHNIFVVAVDCHSLDKWIWAVTHILISYIICTTSMQRIEWIFSIFNPILNKKFWHWSPCKLWWWWGMEGEPVGICESLGWLTQFPFPTINSTWNYISHYFCSLHDISLVFNMIWIYIGVIKLNYNPLICLQAMVSMCSWGYFNIATKLPVV